MKRIAFLVIVALAFSVWQSASPPAQAATACEYSFAVIVGDCEDPGTGACDECLPAVVELQPDPNNESACPTADARSLPDLMACCQACGGTLVFPMGPPLPVGP